MSADIIFGSLVTLVSDPGLWALMLAAIPMGMIFGAVPGLGGKLGIDATNKIGAETRREWGRPLTMDRSVANRIDQMWSRLGLDDVQSANNGNAI